MASQAILEQKSQVVEEIKQKIQQSSSVIIVGYQGLNAEQTTQLRAELRGKGVEFKVLKNRLVARAFHELGYTEFDSVLEQPSAFAFSPVQDPASAAKILLDYANKTGKIQVKMGMVDKVAIDVNGVKELADLPSKEVLIAKVLGMFQAPISGFVRVLNGTIGGLAIALKAIADKQN